MTLAEHIQVLDNMVRDYEKLLVYFKSIESDIFDKDIEYIEDRIKVTKQVLEWARELKVRRKYASDEALHNYNAGRESAFREIKTDMDKYIKQNRVNQIIDKYRSESEVERNDHIY